MASEANTRDYSTQANGHDRSAPRVVARNMSELLHDAITLSDLQYRLFKADVSRLLADLVVPGAILLAGVVLLLSCLPVAMATIALALEQGTDLSLAASFGFTLAGGLILGAGTALVAVMWLRRGIKPFERSREECALNLAWIKKILRDNSTTMRQPLDRQTRERFEP
jgi:hypothetical protein